MGRTLRISLALVAAATLALGACGDDGDDPPAAASSDDEGHASDDTCDAYQDVADLTDDLDAAADPDDLAATQDAYAELGPALGDAYHAAAGASTDWDVIGDLQLLGQLLDQTIDIVASATTADELTEGLSSMPGVQEGESAAERLDTYVDAECGFTL